jgi:hypothetical protein
MIWCNWVGSLHVSVVPIVKGIVQTAQLDWSTCCTSLSSPLIWLNTSSCFASFFSMISSEPSFSALNKNSKSSSVRVVLNVLWVALVFFQDEGFGGVIFLFLE